MTATLLVFHGGIRTLLAGVCFGVALAWAIVEAADALSDRFPPDRRRRWRHSRRERW